jgi:hypothetical protein
MVPFLSLTQSCRQIRTEFRTWWLEQLTVSMHNIHAYLRAFFAILQVPSVILNQAVQVNTTSIRINAAACNADLVPLLKMRALQPNISIFVDWDSDYAHCSEPWSAMFNNENSTWLRWITDGTIRQARVTTRSMSATVASRYPRAVCHTYRRRFELYLVLHRKDARHWLGSTGRGNRVYRSELLERVGLLNQEIFVTWGVVD